MIPFLRRRPADHDHARSLAALRLDETLEPVDAAWLDGHLASCADCAAVAAAYDADRLAFRVLRDAPLVPPRDLWARTAASLDAGSGARARVGGPRRTAGRPSGLVASLAGLAVVALVMGSGLFDGTPIAPQPTGSAGVPPTPIALAAGDVSVLSMSADGGLQIQTRRVSEVCPAVAGECSVDPSFEVAHFAGIGGSDSLDAIISPNRKSLVLVQRGTSGSDGVFVVPVRPAPSALPTSSAILAVPVTPDPTAGASAVETASAGPTESASSPEGSPSEMPSEVPESPMAPTRSPSATPEPTPEVDPSPVVAVTPVPGGALEIASDVVVVGNVSSYNADGTRFAFTARPADGSAGPDVYVWNTDDTVARAVTTDHQSVLAGWDGRQLLVSRIVDGTPRTFGMNARTGELLAEHGREAWLPTVAPSGDRAAWWDGSVKLADDGVSWSPDEGRLVVGSWPDPAGREQVLAKGNVPNWQVRWAPDGSAVALWTADKRRSRTGLLDLYAVDPETGRVMLDAPLREGIAADEGFSLEPGQLAWSAPGKGGDRTVQVLAFEGDTVLGVLELSADGGATVIR